MLTNEQLIDSIIIDCNNSVKELMSGQYVSWCSIMTAIVQKLANLKKAVMNDSKDKDEMIEMLKKELADAGRNIVECKPDELEQKIAELNGG